MNGPDSADRSFYTLVVLVAVPYLALVSLGCGLFTYVVGRLVSDGAEAVLGPGWDVRLALLFFMVTGSGAGIAGWSLRRQWLVTRGLERHVRACRVVPGPSSAAPAALDDVADVAEQAGLGGRVDLLTEEEPFCFTYGLRSPRVAVSRGLVDRTSAEELGAVLAHERYHVRHNDPVKLVVARAFIRAFFFLPILRALHHRYLAARELAADRRAVGTRGRAPLAGALLKTVSGPG